MLGPDEDAPRLVNWSVDIFRTHDCTSYAEAVVRANDHKTVLVVCRVCARLKKGDHWITSNRSVLSDAFLTLP